MAVVLMDSLRQSPEEQKHNIHLKYFLMSLKEITGKDVHFAILEFQKNLPIYSLIFLFNRLRCIFLHETSVSAGEIIQSLQYLLWQHNHARSVPRNSISKARYVTDICNPCAREIEICGFLRLTGQPYLCAELQVHWGTLPQKEKKAEWHLRNYTRGCPDFTRLICEFLS